MPCQHLTSAAASGTILAGHTATVQHCCTDVRVLLNRLPMARGAKFSAD
jgi:hypothetical protein